MTKNSTRKSSWKECCYLSMMSNYASKNLDLNFIFSKNKNSIFIFTETAFDPFQLSKNSVWTDSSYSSRLFKLNYSFQTFNAMGYWSTGEFLGEFYSSIDRIYSDFKSNNTPQNARTKFATFGSRGKIYASISSFFFYQKCLLQMIRIQ